MGVVVSKYLMVGVVVAACVCCGGMAAESPIVKESDPTVLTHSGYVELNITAVGAPWGICEKEHRRIAGGVRAISGIE